MSDDNEVQHLIAEEMKLGGITGELLARMFSNPALKQAVEAGKNVFVPFCQRCKQDYLATEEHDCVPPLSVNEVHPQANDGKS